MGPRLAHQLDLAVRSLRRTPGLSAAMVASLAIATSIWTSGVALALRAYGPTGAVTPALHQVQLPHSESQRKALDGGAFESATWATTTRITFPEYQRLAKSPIPTRHVVTFRSRLLVAGPTPGAVAQIAAGRFTNAALFDLFPIPIGEGRAFSPAEDAAQAPVVVLGLRLAAQLYGSGAAVGQEVVIEGHRFRVVGVAARDQVRSEWDLAASNGLQDAVYLPFSWFRPLLARPETLVLQSPIGPRFEDLLTSDAVFISFWIELPTPLHVAAYRAYLDRALGHPATLRSFPEWLIAFPLGSSPISIYAIITGLLLVGAGFNMARLQLAKAITRRREHGIQRALGATRGDMFTAQVLEALFLSLPAALIGIVLGQPYLDLFDRWVKDSDVPLHLGGFGLICAVSAPVVIGVLSSLYPAWQVSNAAPRPPLAGETS